MKQRMPGRQSAAFLTSFALNLFIAAVALLCNHMVFGTNDDRDISNLLANVSGQNNGHYISFLNIVLAKSLSCLYTWTNNAVNWYVVLSMLLSFLALVFMCELLIRRSFDYKVGLCFCVVLLTWIYKNHYVVFQFSQNAALYSLTGALLLGDGILHGKKDRAGLSCAAGAAFLFLGGLFRFQSLYFIAPYLLLIIGYEALFHHDRSPFFSWLSSHWKPLLSIVVGTVLIFSVRFTHIYYYQVKPALNDYMTANNLRAELMDYGLPDYKQHEEEFTELGLSERDVWLFSKHFCLDRDVYNRAALEGMVNMKQQKGMSVSVENLKLSLIHQIVKNEISSVEHLFFWGILGAGVFFYFLSTNKRHSLLLLFSLLLPVGMLWYYIYVDRLPYRVWYSIALPVFVFVYYFCAIDWRPLSSDGRRIVRVIHLVGISLLIAVSVLSSLNFARRIVSNSSVTVTDSYERILSFAQEHKDTLVLLDRPTISPLCAESTISPFTCLERGSHSNICYTGGWICWTPGNLCVLKNFQTDNPYRSIGKGMEAYLIDMTAPQRKIDFIQRHYNKSVVMEQIALVEGTDIGIYRLYIP